MADLDTRWKLISQCRPLIANVSTTTYLHQLPCLLFMSIFLPILRYYTGTKKRWFCFQEAMVVAHSCGFLYVCFHFNFLLYFPLQFNPLIAPSLCNHHTIVYVHESFFFLLDPSTPQPPPCNSYHPALYESVSI